MPQWNPFQEMETLRREIDHASQNFGLLTAPPFRTAFLLECAARENPLLWCADIELASRRKSQAMKDQPRRDSERREQRMKGLPANGDLVSEGRSRRLHPRRLGLLLPCTL
jgi:hypothetical protein